MTRLSSSSRAVARFMLAITGAFSLASDSLHAQFVAKVRKPYDEAFVVEANAIVVALPQTASHWRTPADSNPGFYSWRLDLVGSSSMSIVLAADTMMRVKTLTQIVAGSTVRRCEDPFSTAAHSCKTIMRDTIGVDHDFVQMILRDKAAVAFMRQTRPATVRVTTYEPHGRFRVERYRIRYSEQTRK